MEKFIELNELEMTALKGGIWWLPDDYDPDADDKVKGPNNGRG